MPIRVVASRHSAFYSPLLCAVKFLRDEGRDVPYAVLKPGQRSHALLASGEAHIMQSAVSSNWSAREQGIADLPVHFAQINCRDGFFLTAAAPDPDFGWARLEGAAISADHGAQPLAMLKYALAHNGVKSARLVCGLPGDYGHYQLPAPEGKIVASVGASMPKVAFSSVCCAKSYQRTEDHRAFLKTFERAKDWVQSAPPEEVAAAEREFFPETPLEALSDAIRRYQEIGTWEGGREIPKALYEQALEVFRAFGGIKEDHRYEEVIGHE
jgi:NitT/TauT family transport system substrate-binding protein